MDATTPRKRIKEMEVMVADAIEETSDTTTLVLFTGNDRLDYKAGHFLTIAPQQFESLSRFIAYFEDLKGRKEPPRAYSMASAPDERYLAITVKEERYVSGQTKYPPLLSPLLVKRTVRGMRLVITGFTGPYVLDDDIESQTDHLVHVCAGSGVVPNYSILKQALAVHAKVRHTFVYSNKTWDDIIFREGLEALLAKYGPGNGDRLRVVHALTRETPERLKALPKTRAEIVHGRVTEELLRSAIPDPAAAVVYACGPGITPYERAAAKAAGTTATPRFLETTLTYLRAMGIPNDRLNYESYG